MVVVRVSRPPLLCGLKTTTLSGPAAIEVQMQTTQTGPQALTRVGDHLGRVGDHLQPARENKLEDPRKFRRKIQIFVQGGVSKSC